MNDHKLLEKAVHCLMNLTHLGLIKYDKARGAEEYQKAEDIIADWRNENPDHPFNQPWY
tara:strand:- start:322 stop:498 length:177 start_codon:yes stop_codon:yes gene_type:complete